MKIAWRLTLVAVMVFGLFATALVTPNEAEATHRPLRGVMIYNMYCHNQTPSHQQVKQWIIERNVQHVRVYMTDHACTDASDLVPILYPNGPVRAVTLHAGQNTAELGDAAIWNVMFRKHGIVYQGQRWSYADIYDTFHNHVDFYIQIGNEPDNFFNGDQWLYRWYALNAYKQLAMNACNKYPFSFDSRFPKLEWSLALPAHNFQYMIDMFLWKRQDQNDPGCSIQIDAGSVVDYYDVMNPHLYGDHQIPDQGTQGWQIWQHVRDNYHNSFDLILTEVGIDQGTLPSKCDNALRNFVRSGLDPYAPRVRAYSYFYIGGPAGYEQYRITTSDQLRACSGHYS